MPSNQHSRHQEHCFGITALSSKHPSIKALMKKVDGHSHHGHKIWDTSLLLMDYFSQYPLERGCRVLEIGCGWGLTGIFLAKQFQCDVTAVDIDTNVFPFLQVHADLNGVDVECVQSPYEKLTENFLKTFDVVIGGDICFWDELTKKLSRVVKKSYAAHTRFVCSDPGRQPFYDLVTLCQKKYACEYLDRRIKYPKKFRGFILDVDSKG